MNYPSWLEYVSLGGIVIYAGLIVAFWEEYFLTTQDVLLAPWVSRTVYMLPFAVVSAIALAVKASDDGRSTAITILATLGILVNGTFAIAFLVEWDNIRAVATTGEAERPFSVTFITTVFFVVLFILSCAFAGGSLRRRRRSSSSRRPARDDEDVPLREAEKNADVFDK